MKVTFTTAPSPPGDVVIRVRVTDPTGYDAHEWGGYGIGGSATIDLEGPGFGDGPASCNGHDDPPQIEVRPAELDQTVERSPGPGTHTIRVRAYSNACHEVNTVDIDETITLP